MDNYRPIFLLSLFGKIFESIVSARLSTFLTKYNLFYEYQFGFRENHSTKLALLNSIDDILNSQSNKHFVAGIFLDLSKAFDSIDHSILIAKLHCYGVRGTMLKWFCSYLSNRSQYTEINGSTSNYFPITYGVPQGSVLGPLLFLIFINDLGNIDRANISPKLFADDTNVFVHSENMFDLRPKCQDAINKISSWLISNKLTLNTDKTFYMVFSVVQSCNYHIRALRHIRPLLSHDLACQIACSIVASRLDY